MYDDVLLPTDGSPGVERAIEEAVGIASATGARLHVLYVVEPLYWSEVNAERLLEALAEEGERATAAVAERAEAADVEVVAEIRQGYPSEAILEYADEAGVDAIVMGTHGRRGLSRMLLGSTTERVVRAADVPVVTVRMAEAEREAEEGGEVEGDESDASGE